MAFVLQPAEAAHAGAEAAGSEAAAGAEASKTEADSGSVSLKIKQSLFLHHVLLLYSRHRHAGSWADKRRV